MSASVGDSRVAPTPTHYREWLIFAAIMLLAAGMRLGAPGIFEFKRDEATISLLALDLVKNHQIPWLGMDTSVGLPNSPLSVYILAIPFFISSNPIVANSFIALLNVFAVGLLYFLARRYYGQFAAVVAGVTYAAAPWAVVFSRKLWALNMLPFFVMLALLTGFLGFIDGKRWAQWLHLPLVIVALQIHYSAIVLLPISLVLLISGRKNWSKAFRWSVALTLLILLPYLIGLQHENWAKFSRWLDTLSENEESENQTSSFRLAQIAVSGTDLHSLAGAEAFQVYLDTVPDVYPLFDLMGAIIWLSGIGLIGYAFRTNQIPLLILPIWLLFLPLLFALNLIAPALHYFIPMLPAAFLILGVAVQFLWDKNRYFGIAAMSAIGIAVFFQVWMWIGFLNFVDKNPTPGGFGVPYHYLDEVRSAALDQNPPDVIVDLGNQFVDIGNEPTVWNALLYDVPTLRFGDEYTQVFPVKNALVLGNKCDQPADQIFGLRNQEEGCYTLNTQPMLDLSPYRPISETLHFANGVRLVAYQWENGCFDLAWEIEQTTTLDYTFAIHFLAENGNKITQGDALSWSGRFWRPGDTVIRTFCIEPVTAAQVAGLNIGMYTYDGTNFQNVDVLDENGSWVSQFIEINID